MWSKVIGCAGEWGDCLQIVQAKTGPWSVFGPWIVDGGSQPSCLHTSQENIHIEALSISAWRVIIWQSVKILIKSLCISTVTCTYPLNSDKVTVSLCTQASRYTSVHTCTCMWTAACRFYHICIVKKKHCVQTYTCTFTVEHEWL